MLRWLRLEVCSRAFPSQRSAMTRTSHCHGMLCSLSLQGFALAKRLHDDAVGRGAIMALAPGLAVPAAFQAAASSLTVRAFC